MKSMNCYIIFRHHSIDHTESTRLSVWEEHAGGGYKEYKFPNIELVKVLPRNVRCPSGIQKEYH